MAGNIQRENQHSIADWAKTTFGPVHDPAVLVERAELELFELKEAVAKGDAVEVGKETADVVILLHRLLDQFQLTLETQINQKMAENRKRNWIAKGDGTGHHVA